MFSCMYTHVKMNQIVHFKYVRLIACQLHINKAMHFCDLIQSSSLETVQ